MCEIHQSPCECLFQRTQLILLGARPSPEIFMLTSMSLMALRQHMTCLVNDVCHAGPVDSDCPPSLRPGLRLSEAPTRSLPTPLRPGGLRRRMRASATGSASGRTRMSDARGGGDSEARGVLRCGGGKRIG